MRALDAYRDLHREIDRNESPEITIKDFNYWINITVNDFIRDNYVFFDTLQKEVDDMRNFVNIKTPVTLTNLSGTLPTDYRHILFTEVKAKFKVKVGKYAANTEITLYPEREKSSQKGYRKTNYYHKPSYKTPYYEIAGNTIKLNLGSKVEPVAAPHFWIDYVKQTPEIYVNPAQGADLNEETNNTTLLFNTGSVRNNIYFQIIRLCRNNILSNIESPRLASAVAETQSAPE